jgi:glutamate/tyrosine decarboxylase-like PLP-dependent enzyme
VTEEEFRALLMRGFDGIARWETGFRPFTPHPSLDVEPQTARAVLDELVTRLGDNYPFHHPDYAAQMLRPPHPVALAAYAVTARINPNNHALDGGPATARLEVECIAALARMLGLREPYLGHLTSSGTIANLEALWVASRLHPGKAVLISAEAHYTHARMCGLLGIECVVAPADRAGRLDVAACDHLEPSRIGTLVLTAGTTATGAVDAVEDLVALARGNGWRVHADAAYGGFFAILADDPQACLHRPSWRALGACDSIVVDPHKHGLQPYGCGAVLFADPSVGRFYKHDSPYTYFTSSDLHLGEISLECSRAGAAAAALWATLQCLPLTPEGLGRSLLACRRAALAAHRAALRDGRLTPVVAPDLDILTLAPVRAGEHVAASEVSRRTARIFAAAQKLSDPLFVATWRLPAALGRLALPHLAWDADHCLVLRSVLLKPEHEAVAEPLVHRLAELASS